MKYPWIRILKVTLSNQVGSTITLGGIGSKSLDITVDAIKKFSPLQDEAKVTITNLGYTQMLQIIRGQYFNIKIECGYTNRGTQTIFNGGILYMSNELVDKQMNKVIILCASKLIARFGQVRMSLTLNSSINLYTAMNFVLKHAGIDTYTLSPDLKSQKLGDYFNLKTSTPQNYLTYFQEGYDNIIKGISSDNSNGSSVNILSTSKRRKMVINNDVIDISNGYPQMTNSGLSLTVVPIANFMPGDIIVVDNSMIDISASTMSDFKQNIPSRLQQDGSYVLSEVRYVLQNRGQNFYCSLQCALTEISATTKSDPSKIKHRYTGIQE